MSTEAIGLIGDGEKVCGGGGRGRLYTCIKMGSGENHFKVSLIVAVSDKVTRRCPQTMTI